jgi:hypothetical protein
MTFRNVLRNRNQAVHERHRDDLRAFCADQLGATPIGALTPRVEATMVGEITSVRLVPKVGRSPWLEVTVSDGEGRMVLMWTGRKSIPGIRPGRRVKASGRPAATGPGGRLVLMNPIYELL